MKRSTARLTRLKRARRKRSAIGQSATSIGGRWQLVLACRCCNMRFNSLVNRPRAHARPRPRNQSKLFEEEDEGRGRRRKPQHDGRLPFSPAMVAPRASSRARCWYGRSGGARTRRSRGTELSRRTFCLFFSKAETIARASRRCILSRIGWFVAVLAIAGPTWRREPSPFADDTAALAIVVKVSPSMTTEDVQPSRLTRATQKIHDLLKQRAGAKTSLIAYAGTAHVVMPATTDGGIIDTFAQALDPKIMPKDGDAAADALRLAEQTLAEAGSGSILWITDSIAPEQSCVARCLAKIFGYPRAFVAAALARPGAGRFVEPREGYGCQRRATSRGRCRRDHRSPARQSSRRLRTPRRANVGRRAAIGSPRSWLCSCCHSIAAAG